LVTIVGLVIVVGLLSVLAGLGVKYWLDWNNSEYRITRRELTVGIPVMIILVVIVANVGYSIAWTQNVTFHEYWNGWELSADKPVLICTKDGPCKHTYACDSYPCHPHDCFCTCTSHDKEGNCTSESCQTCWDTCWHQCPYCDTETNYRVTTTLGTFDIRLNVLPSDPQNHRWYSPGDSGEREYYSAIPQSVINDAGTGVPPFWQAVADRVAAGNPGPVTVRRDYMNYILASDSLLKQYSSYVEALKKQGLLPALQTGIRDWYMADKVYFVGYRPDNTSEWQTRGGYLNAAVGTELQGDLHVVVVQNAEINAAPDTYLFALKAYWQDPAYFGHDAISKNTIIVVIGTTDGKTVAWGRAITGMPLGNEVMQVAVRNIFATGEVPLTPSAVLGQLSGSFYQRQSKDGSMKADVKGVHHEPVGALETVLFGLKDSAARFTRIAMAGNSGDGSGFAYLASEIQLTTGQVVLVALITFIVSCVIWAALAVIDF
jgi:hypothetical protein